MKDKVGRRGGREAGRLYVSFSLGLILCPLCVTQCGKLLCALCKGMQVCAPWVSTNIQMEMEKRNWDSLQKDFNWGGVNKMTDVFLDGINLEIRT